MTTLERTTELSTPALINRLAEIDWKRANLIMGQAERDILARAHAVITVEINTRAALALANVNSKMYAWAIDE